MKRNFDDTIEKVLAKPGTYAVAIKARVHPCDAGDRRGDAEAYERVVFGR